MKIQFSTSSWEEARVENEMRKRIDVTLKIEISFFLLY